MSETQQSVREWVLDSLNEQVRLPLQVSSADAVNWDDEVEVAVVGYGAAGACAALQASKNGVKIAILDRFNGGGASALSGGVVYAGGGTRFQRQAGDDDSIENMYNYLKLEAGDVISKTTLRRFCEQSVANLEWLQAHGVPFDSTTFDSKTSYPPEGHFLYYSGNETAAPYRDQAVPSRRGHRVKGKGMTGRLLMSRLNETLQMCPHVQVKPHCDVQRLIVDPNNRVLGLEYQQAPRFLRGVMGGLLRLANKFALMAPGVGRQLRRVVHHWRQQGERRCLRVSRGVVLSAGGFVFNRPLLEKVASDYRHAMPLGEECNGAGIALGVSVGGDVAHMSHVSAWRFFSPPIELLKGIVVTADGRRICNEDLYGATSAQRVLASGSSKAYLILDQTLMDAAKKEAWPGQYSWQQWMPARLFLHASARKGQTLGKLTQRCGFKEALLEQTVSDYNTGVTGRCDEFGKADKYCQTLTQGPFYAVDISLDNTRVPCPAITLGGLTVDESTSAVLDVNGEKIEGLYAAGRNAVGICSNSYISGLSLADCVFSGRRAGAHAAQQ